MSAEQEQATGVSKSAKRRAAKKARDAAGAEEAAPVEAPQPKAATKAAPKAAGKAEPKASSQAKAAPEAPKAAQSKAKPKGEPKPEAKPTAKAEPKKEPAKPEPKKEAAAKSSAKAKPQTKQAAKQQAKQVKEEEPPKKKENEVVNYVEFDDGTGGEWEMASGLTKKQQKQKERKEEKEKERKELEKELSKQGGPSAQMGTLQVPANQKVIPGMAPVGATGYPDAKASQPKAKAPTTAAAAIAEAQPETKTKSAETLTVINIPVASEKIGRIIGPKGSTLKLIMEKTGVDRIEPSEGEGCTISGSAQACQLAEMAVKELVEKGWTSLAYENFQDAFVTVHPSAFPDLIGKEGKVIRKIKEELSVEIDIPQGVTVANAPKGKKYKVGLAGGKDNVEKAKEAINSILMYGHSDITHPGFIHEEIEIEDWALKYVIGTKGSELRHIQNSMKVTVRIPREFSVNTKPVIVGEPVDVAKAKTHIENVIWKAQNQTRGRGGQDGAVDTWGDEGEDEEWMKQYLYKR